MLKDNIHEYWLIRDQVLEGVYEILGKVYHNSVHTFEYPAMLYQTHYYSSVPAHIDILSIIIKPAIILGAAYKFEHTFGSEIAEKYESVFGNTNQAHCDS